MSIKEFKLQGKSLFLTYSEEVRYPIWCAAIWTKRGRKVGANMTTFRPKPGALTTRDTISLRVAGIKRRVPFARATLRIWLVGSKKGLVLKVVSKRTKSSGEVIPPEVSSIELNDGTRVYARTTSAYGRNNTYLDVQFSLRPFSDSKWFPSTLEQNLHAMHCPSEGEVSRALLTQKLRVPPPPPRERLKGPITFPEETELVYHSGVPPKRKRPVPVRLVDRFLRLVAWTMSATVQVTLVMLLLYLTASGLTMFVTLPVSAFSAMSDTYCPFSGPMCQPKGADFSCSTHYNHTVIDHAGMHHVTQHSNTCFSLAALSARSKDIAGIIYETDSTLFSLLMAFCVVTYLLYGVRAAIQVLKWLTKSTEAVAERHSRTTKSVKEALMPYLDSFFEWLGLASTPSLLDFTEVETMELLVGSNASVGMFESILNDPATSRYAAARPPPAAISFSVKIDSKLHVVGWGTRIQLSGKSYTATALHVIVDAMEMGQGEVWLSGTSQVDGKTVSVRYPPETRMMAKLYSSDQVILEVPQRIYAQLGIKAATVKPLRQESHITMYTPDLERPGKWVLQVTKTEAAKGNKSLPGQFFHTADTVHSTSGLGVYQGRDWVGTHNAGSSDGNANIGFSSNLLKLLDSQIRNKESWTETQHWAEEFRISEAEANKRLDDEYYVVVFGDETWYLERDGVDEVWRMRMLAEEFEKKLLDEEDDDDWIPGDAWDEDEYKWEREQEWQRVNEWLAGPGYFYESASIRGFLNKFLSKMVESRAEHLKVTRGSYTVHVPSNGGPENQSPQISTQQAKLTFAEAVQRLRSRHFPSTQSTPAPPSSLKEGKAHTPSRPETVTPSLKVSPSNTEEQERLTGPVSTGQPQSSSTTEQSPSGRNPKKKPQDSPKGKEKEEEPPQPEAPSSIPTTPSSAKSSTKSRKARRQEAKREKEARKAKAQEQRDAKKLAISRKKDSLKRSSPPPDNTPSQ